MPNLPSLFSLSRMSRFIPSLTLAALISPIATAQQPAFEPQTIDASVQIGYGLAIGDVDGDAKPDILLADKSQIVWYRNGDWQKFVIAENLTERDNVCLAAADINGDGMVELAVGAQWNPGETTNTDQSGAVFYMIRPEDPTQKWEPVRLPHDPTTHRMRWYKRTDGVTQLIVLPLHGIGNSNGEGEGVKITAYTVPQDPRGEWQTEVIDNDMHMTHNLDVAPGPGGMQWMLFAGKEGVKTIWYGRDSWSKDHRGVDGVFYPAGEVRAGAINPQNYEGLYATIEPLHGNTVAAYGVQFGLRQWQVTRHVLDESLNEGHGLVVADVLGQGRDQVVAGWRRPDAEGKVGIRLYAVNGEGNWTTHTIDDNQMAVEDLKAADLDGDGDLDLIASGRATNNLVVYWNRTGE